AILAGLVTLTGAGAASAQTVFQSGDIFHVAACNEALQLGMARCHAHIVTDRAGNHLIDRFVPNRFERHATSNAVPAGFGPTALVRAYNPIAAANYPAGVGSSGTIIAIVDAYGYTNAEKDLGVYRST